MYVSGFRLVFFLLKVKIIHLSIILSGSFSSPTLFLISVFSLFHSVQKTTSIYTHAIYLVLFCLCLPKFRCFFYQCPNGRAGQVQFSCTCSSPVLHSPFIIFCLQKQFNREICMQFNIFYILQTSYSECITGKDPDIRGNKVNISFPWSIQTVENGQQFSMVSFSFQRNTLWTQIEQNQIRTVRIGLFCTNWFVI